MKILLNVKSVPMPEWGNDLCRQVIDEFNNSKSILQLVIDTEKPLSMSDIAITIDDGAFYDYIFPDNEYGAKLKDLVEDSANVARFLPITSEDCELADVI